MNTTRQPLRVIPALGAKRLRDLRAADVDRMLSARRTALSTTTLQALLSILRRAIRWGEARDLVARNVTLACTAPTGRSGRPSKSMTLNQAQAVLQACGGRPMGAYVVLALLVGARNEELRALRWDHVNLDRASDTTPPVPPSIRLWRSVRAGGDTKTKLSRRTLALPDRAVTALVEHRSEVQRRGLYRDGGLVFATISGQPLDSANVRRSFRGIVEAAGLDPGEWTPRELRHSFVSLMVTPACLWRTSPAWSDTRRPR